jgi:hypothetical protein
MSYSMFGKKVGIVAMTLTLIFPLAFMGSIGQAEENVPVSGPTSDITINPLGFIGWGPDIEFEHAFGPTFALALRGKFGGFTIGDWKNSSLGGGASLRFYLQEECPAPRGLFIGPGFDVLNVTSQYGDGDKVSSRISSVFGQMGYRWLFGKKTAFVLSPYINMGYTMGSIKWTDQTLDLTGLLFGIGLAIGVAF